MIGRMLLMLVLIIGLLIPVYQPSRPLLPVYYIDVSPTGEVWVYSPKDLIFPRFTIRDGRIYKRGELVLPSFEVKTFLEED